MKRDWELWQITPASEDNLKAESFFHCHQPLVLNLIGKEPKTILQLRRSNQTLLGFWCSADGVDIYVSHCLIICCFLRGAWGVAVNGQENRQGTTWSFNNSSICRISTTCCWMVRISTSSSWMVVWALFSLATRHCGARLGGLAAWEPTLKLS